jgi:uncharacterized protein YicC (UPF0701 family)
MVKNTDNYDEIIRKLMQDFESDEINGVEYFRRMRKICVAARAKNEDDEKYDKVINEIEKATKDLNHMFKKESQKIREALNS